MQRIHRLRQCLASQFIWIKRWKLHWKQMAIGCCECGGMHGMHKSMPNRFMDLRLVDTAIPSSQSHSRDKHVSKCILSTLNIYNEIKSNWNCRALQPLSVKWIPTSNVDRHIRWASASYRKRECTMSIILWRCQMSLGGTIVNEMLLFRLICSNLVIAFSTTIMASSKSTISRANVMSTPQANCFHINRFDSRKYVMFDGCTTEIYSQPRINWQILVWHEKQEKKRQRYAWGIEVETLWNALILKWQAHTTHIH